MKFEIGDLVCLANEERYKRYQHIIYIIVDKDSEEYKFMCAYDDNGLERTDIIFKYETWYMHQNYKKVI